MAASEKDKQLTQTDFEKFDFRSSTADYNIIFDKGLNEKVVREISRIKGEPEWMLELRLKSLKIFNEKPMPSWGANLSGIDFQDITYYMSTGKGNETDWKDVPEDVKKTFDKLGIPEAERKFLAGVGAQYESEVVYHSIRKDLEEKGVVFLSMDDGLRQYPELVKDHFSKVIPISDNKFAALNSAVWSGGSFVYIPKGVKVDIPLQAYFRINAQNMGQFERTLIIADEGSQVHYIEGCFTKGTLIVTESGVKPIEDVQKGEKVWTHQNRFQEVYHTQVRPYSGGLNIITYYGDTTQEIEATDEHPFLIVSRQKKEYKNTDWKPVWSEAKLLNKGDYLAIPIDRQIKKQSQRSFSIKMGAGRHGFKDQLLTIETDLDFFRLIGYYLAEGTTINEHYVSFSFNEQEKEYINDVKQLVRKYLGEEIDEQKPYNGGISLILNSTLVARFFNQEFNHHAHTKQIPKWVMEEDPTKQKQLLKGYWCGDGSYMYEQYAYGTKRMFRMNTVSRELAGQVRDLLLRQNIFASINKQQRAKPRKNMYCVYVGGSHLQMFADLVEVSPSNEAAVGNQTMFQKISMVTAKSYAQITEKYAFVPIKKIERKTIENIPVYNFSVDQDESYVAGGVVVHNCTAPRYSTNSLHSAVVEVIAKKGSHVRYTTIQNWSNNIYNLVTKRAIAHENATVEWVDGNLGSKVTMKYPCIILAGEGAKGEVLSIALAGKAQHQDAGAKIIHLAKNTTSTITSKSISKNGGQASYRGLVKVKKGCTGVKSTVRCDALLLDSESRTDTYPTIEIDEPSATIAHEATVGKVGEDQIFYLMSRGLSETESLTLIVMGFVQPFTKSLPMEYAVELNRLIELEMEGSIG